MRAPAPAALLVAALLLTLAPGRVGMSPTPAQLAVLERRAAARAERGGEARAPAAAASTEPQRPLALPGPALHVPLERADTGAGGDLPPALLVGRTGEALRLRAHAAPEGADHAARTAFGVWDGAAACAAWFAAAARGRFAGVRSVLELGAGTGLAGLAAAAELGVAATLTDLPEAVRALEGNAKLNRAAARAGVRALDWTTATREELSALAQRHAGGIVVAADVVWLIELVRPLVRCLEALALPVALAYQSRSTRVDRALFAALEEAGFRRERVDPIAEGIRPTRTAARIDLYLLTPRQPPRDEL